MIRCSKLNEAEDCGLAATIETKSTTLAAMSGDAFHAGTAHHYRPRVARFKEARDLTFGVLDNETRQTVVELIGRLAASWNAPDDAEFEVPVGLSRSGTWVPYDSPEAMTRGTADIAWIEDDIVVVPDLKSGARAEWNVPPPANNLQCSAYGLALADLHGKTKVRTGIYLAHEVKWLWHTVDLDSAEGTRLWERVRGAALRDPDEAVVGPHCSECWVRLNCRAHLLPAISEIERDHALAPLSEPVGDKLIEPGKLTRMLQTAEAMEEISKRAKEFLKAYVAQHGPVVDGDKQWGPSPVKGRESTSITALKEAGLYERAVIVGAVKQGAPTMQHRWKNRRDDKEAA